MMITATTAEDAITLLTATTATIATISQSHDSLQRGRSETQAQIYAAWVLVRSSAAEYKTMVTCKIKHWKNVVKMFHFTRSHV